MTEQPAVSVHRNESAHRFEAELDGTIVGFIDYRQRGDEITLIHTETNPAFGGRGVGTALARFAFDEVRQRGEQAVILCPFLRSYLSKHPGEYDDLLLHHT